MLKLLTGILGLALVVLFWQLGWQFGYLALILYVLWAIRQMPTKFHRRLMLAYPVFVVTLFSSTLMHGAWVRSDALQRRIQQSALLRALAGDAYRQAFWATLLGLGLGVAVVWAAFQALLYISAEYVLDLSQGLKLSRAEAMRYLRDLFLGRKKPSVTVDDGKIVGETGPGVASRIGGPAMLIVRPGNAVVLESGEGVSRIVGSGCEEMKPSEKIKLAVPLGPQEESVPIPHVLTKDRIPLDFEVNVSFQIEPRADTDKRPETFAERKRFDQVVDNVYPVYQESVYKAAYKASKGDWRKATCDALQGTFRDVLARHNLDEIYDYPVATGDDLQAVAARQRKKPLMLSDLEKTIQREAAKTAVAWGVRVNRVEITSVRMPEEIWEKLLAWWQTKIEVKIALQEAEREAAVLEKRLEYKKREAELEVEKEAHILDKRLGFHQDALRLEGDYRVGWLDDLLKTLRRYTKSLQDEDMLDLLLHLATQGERFPNEAVIKALVGRGLPTLFPPEQVEPPKGKEQAGGRPADEPEERV